MATETVTFNVSGVTYNDRQSVLTMLNKHFLTSGERLKVMFVPEPENQYDKNAVRIDIDYNQKTYNIGYVSRDINEDVVWLINAGYKINPMLISVSRMKEAEPFGAKISFEVTDDKC